MSAFDPKRTSELPANCQDRRLSQLICIKVSAPRSTENDSAWFVEVAGQAIHMVVDAARAGQTSIKG
jgi:hypothetical protein